MFGRLFRLDRETATRRADELLAMFGLSDAAGKQPKAFSGGMRRRLDLAASMILAPKVLFLDEPTTGLDPQAKRNVWKLVEELNSRGMTIVLTTHNMEEAEYLCGRIAIMDHGRVVAEGSPQQLIMQHAPEPPEARLHGNLEDVFLKLTGHGLRE
jgi:ABC-2 type transport system ATP-binding protein